MKIYAIIPARSGSKGMVNKNIKEINGRPLIDYSISFAKKLGIDRVFCSTDSEEYRNVALKCGAEVPFLRDEKSSLDTSMEQDILLDLNKKFEEFEIEKPDILVWLRPTFVFRDLELVKQGINLLKTNSSFSAVRTVCETESRLYSIDTNNYLQVEFDDLGKSMVRRQDLVKKYKVFSTDIFRFNDNTLNDDFLGREVYALEINKICGLDIDDEIDFNIVKYLIESNLESLRPYIH